MEGDFTSEALAANLALTKSEQVEFPERHRWFVTLSAAYWGIHKRAEEFINEYNHQHPNYGFIIQNLHTISLTDLWLYKSIAENREALLFLLDIFEELLIRGMEEKLQEQLAVTLFKFTDKLVEEKEFQDEAVWQCLKLIEQGMEKSEDIYLRNAGYFKMYLDKAAAIPLFNQEICRLTKKILLKSSAYWQETANAEGWFASKAGLFRPVCQDKIKKIGQGFFSALITRIEASRSWDEIKSNYFFNDIANHFRHFSEEFELFNEKIYYLIFALRLPGMAQLKNHLLYDLNRMIKGALAELDDKELYSFIDNLFNLFGELKNQHMNTILDCLFTLGKEIVGIDDQRLTTYYIEELIAFGFVYPGKVEITGDWQTKVNPDHIKNIRIWLDLIDTSPYNFKKLLSALVVNLKPGGIFISDTDLFQRDVTKLLNSDIGPVYKQVKQLARLFPVYYNKIGAEGKLRDVSTAMDELTGRKDRLIHYVRKQIHAESNNTHIELVRLVAGFWYNGKLEALRAVLPRDVFEAIDLQDEHYSGINRLMRAVGEHFQVESAGLLKLPEKEVTDYIHNYEPATERDKKRLSCLLQLNRLLLDKYSLEVRDVVDVLSQSRFFSEQQIGCLKDMLDQNQYHLALEQIYTFIGVLKEVILSKTKTEATETIYYKRHIAVGIPSMYGQYREPKFEALGLMYRLEQVASRLIEKILAGIKLEYISAKTFNNIYEVLVLFKIGLELDGMVNQNFNSALEMFRYSLTSTSVTLSQYMNTFRFMAQHIKEMINEYFMRVYDESIKVVIPQVFNRDQETVARESEIFYREILSSAFLIQELDQFIANSLDMINRMVENYSEAHIHNMMTYNPDLAVSPLNRATPKTDNQVFLGAKAYYLKKLISCNLPVPCGFVLTTEVYRHKDTIFKHPYMSLELEKLIISYLAEMERSENLKFGSSKRPMLLSVRSGTVITMPGAMSTFLNIGMNDEIAEALGRRAETSWMGWDSYRRFIQSWGMSHGVDRDVFDEVMTRYKNRYGVDQKSNFSAAQMKELARAYQEALNENGVFIVDDPLAQLKQAINNVFDSWSAKRAVAYRKHLQIADEWGTAVIVQKMVMGNRSKRSGSGVAFTHNPKLKKPGINLYGDFTLCSQGEDIVAGLVYTLPVSESQREDGYHHCRFSLESAFPRIYKRLYEIATELIEKYNFNNQEIEFTFESEDPDDLYILQIREQSIIQKEKTAVFSAAAGEMKLIGKGIGAGGGCMSGMVSFDMEDLLNNKKRYPAENHILVRPDTVPDDIQMIFICDGLVTGRGGVTSHAAVAAGQLGKVCVVNCRELVVNDREKRCQINNQVIEKGNLISIDGNLGHIYLGRYPVKYI